LKVVFVLFATYQEKKVNLTRERCGSEGKLMKEKVAREGAGDES